jgi:hypothetical protein
LIIDSCSARKVEPGFAAQYSMPSLPHSEVALSPSFARLEPLAQQPVERPKIVQPLRLHPLRHPSGNRDDQPNLF